MKLLIAYLGSVIFILTVEAQSQGIKGQVLWLDGNQMPSPGKTPAPQKGIIREIYIYKAASLQDVEQLNGFYTTVNTALVGKTVSDVSGSFKIKLPPGEYSIFTKESKGLFGNIFNKDGKINYVTVNPKKYSNVTINVNYQAVY